MRVALGLKARTGRAILVAIGRGDGEPRMVERVEFKTLPEGAFAPYHVAEELKTPQARDASVKRDMKIAHELAAGHLRAAAKRVADAGHEVVAAGVLIGTGMPAWTTEEIVAVHVRMHKAEGELFRNVLVAGADALGVPLLRIAGKAALDDAAKRLGIRRAQLDAQLAVLGKSAGPPWGKDQKEAAAAALAALAQGR